MVTADHANLLQHLGIERAYMVGHDYSALIMHKFVRVYRDMTIKGLTIDPIVPGFEERYLSVGHFPESWYSQFHQLDMAVEVVSSSRAATRAYFKHFLSHWSYDKNLITDDGDLYRQFRQTRQHPRRLQLLSGEPLAHQRALDTSGPHHLGRADDLSRRHGRYRRASVWTDQVTNWYNNYTIEYVPDGGHFP